MKKKKKLNNNDNIWSISSSDNDDNNNNNMKIINDKLIFDSKKDGELLRNIMNENNKQIVKKSGEMTQQEAIQCMEEVAKSKGYDITSFERENISMLLVCQYIFGSI